METKTKEDFLTEIHEINFRREVEKTCVMENWLGVGNMMGRIGDQIESILGDGMDGERLIDQV